MREADFDQFGVMLDAVCGLLSRGTYAPSPANTALWFRALAEHDLEAVRAGFDGHVRDPQRGRFVPTPADVLAQIEALANDGRPGSEEAWAMVPIGEDQTVVWTTEMAEAYGACSQLLATGDRIGARMAFKEAYERLVDQAKRAGRRPVWQASLGSDADKRKRELTAAVDAGKLTAEAAHEQCPVLPMPSSQRALLPPPVPGDGQTFREILTELVEAKRTSTEPVDPLGWARRLRDREQAGEDLSVAQRQDWRIALDSPIAHTVEGGFSPIPNELLPPDMRKGVAP
jgi:hypothetical protein